MHINRRKAFISCTLCDYQEKIDISIKIHSGNGACGDGCTAFQGRNRLEESAGRVLAGGIDNEL